MASKIFRKNIAFLILFIFCGLSFGTKIKDIATFEGNRPNMLIGYGIVAGLNGTGDGKATVFTINSLSNMLTKMGITINQALANQITTKNIAAVMVTAKIPPYAKAGMPVNVTVSSLGDAKSLQGGTLLLTPLKGPDGKTYALAQGQVVVGQASAGATATQGSSLTVGIIPNGAILERSIPYEMPEIGYTNLYLNYPDFNTAMRVQDAINRVFPGTATAIDSSTIRIKLDPKYNPVDFLAKIGDIKVKTSMPAKIVVDSRTGTIVIGGNVTIKPVAVASGDLSVEIKPNVSAANQPPSQNNNKSKKHLFFVKGTTVYDLVNSLNKVGASPSQIISILEAMEAQGAINGKLEVE